MRSALCLLLSLLGVAPLARPLHAQLVAGTLLEAESRVPLADGLISLLDEDSATVAQVRTDSVGAFSFELGDGGSYRLRAERIGYLAATSPPLRLRETDTVQVEFRLAQYVVMLEPLVVTARSRRLTPAARRFYERAETGGFGAYITRAEIEKRQPLYTSDLLRRLPGVQTRQVMGGNDVIIRGDCRPTVYVDGTRANGYRSLDDLVQPLDVEGIEVYRSVHNAPVEFTGLRAGCAVILIWTRIQ